MLGSLFAPPRVVDVDCRIEVSNTFDSLHAHVELDGSITIEPGDEVTVHGDPIHVPYGSELVLHRRASVRKAGAIKRTWTRLTGDLEFMELCEFSFSPEARPNFAAEAKPTATTNVTSIEPKAATSTASNPTYASEARP